MYRWNNAIRALFNVDKENIEIEARIGRYTQRGVYTSGVKPYIFNRVREQLLDSNVYQRYIHDEPPFRQENEDTFVLSKDKGNIRAISTVKPEEASISDWLIEEKKRIDVVNIPEYNVRVSAASEEESSLSPKEKEKFILEASLRRRERTSVIYDGVFRGLRVDMTKVTYFPSGRLEYQIEIEAKTSVETRTFLLLVEFVLKLNQGSHILMNTTMRFALGKQYNTLMNQNLPPFQRGGDPFNLTRDYSDPVDITLNDMMISSPQPYTVSIKADGKRLRLFVSRKSVYLVDPPHFLGLQYSDLFDELDFNDTILEGEYVYTRNGNAVFLVYDCLILKGVDVGAIPDHMQRHYMARDFVEAFNTSLKLVASPPIFQCRLKEVIPGNPFESYEAAKAVLSRRNTYDFEDDGLIYTPLRLSYPATTGGKIKKWKPLEKLTIDFAVNRVDASNLYKLFLIDKNRLVPFRDMTATITHTIPDNSIVAMRWSGEQFEMTSLRFDKETPNALRTGENVWRAIQNPIPESEIVGEGLKLMRKWHLLIKKYWIEAFGKGSTLLDVGSGQGGDIVAWKENHDTVYAVEPNKTNMEELNRRLDYYSFKRATVLNMGAEETFNVIEALGGATITGVALFSVLTYFFESKSKLQNLVNTISSVLERGGKVHGLVLDGNKVADVLREHDKIITPPYSIVPMTAVPEKIEYGVEIEIDMHGTMVVKQREYLVNYSLFRDMMVEAGFEETHSENVSPPPYLNRYSALLTSMHRTFAFERKMETPELEIGPTVCERHEPVKPLRMDVVEPICLSGLPDGMVRIGIIGDGSCFIHTILRSFSSVYLKKRKEDRSKYACTVRSAISMYLNPEIYKELPGSVKEKYEYPAYKEKIETCKSWQGWESAYLYRLYFQKNVYIYRDTSGFVPLELSGTCGDVYPESVVLFFIGDKHYELVGQTVGGRLRTVFTAEDPFISEIHGMSCRR
jgi:hypothetical protein